MQMRSRPMIRRSGRRGAWTPIALTWRRLHRPVVRPIRPPPALAISCAWLPRVNIRLDFAVNAAGPAPALPARTAPTVLWRRAGTGPSALPPILRDTPPTGHRDHTRHTERQVFATAHWQSVAGWHEIVRLHRAASASSRGVSARTVGGNAADVAVRGRPTSPAMEALRLPRLRTPAANRPAVTAPPLVLRRMPEAFGAARAEQAAASPLRTPDLVWRNRAGEPPAVADVPAERAFAQSGGDLARAAPPPAASPEGIAGPRHSFGQRQGIQDEARTA
jgi:hypothetical protein